MLNVRCSPFPPSFQLSAFSPPASTHWTACVAGNGYLDRRAGIPMQKLIGFKHAPVQEVITIISLRRWGNHCAHGGFVPRMTTADVVIRPETVFASGLGGLDG